MATRLRHGQVCREIRKQVTKRGLRNTYARYERRRRPTIDKLEPLNGIIAARRRRTTTPRAELTHRRPSPGCADRSLAAPSALNQSRVETCIADDLMHVKTQLRICLTRLGGIWLARFIAQPRTHDKGARLHIATAITRRAEVSAQCLFGATNDCRIESKTASTSTGRAARPLRRLRIGLSARVPPSGAATLAAR